MFDTTWQPILWACGPNFTEMYVHWNWECVPKTLQGSSLFLVETEVFGLNDCLVLHLMASHSTALLHLSKYWVCHKKRQKLWKHIFLFVWQEHVTVFNRSPLGKLIYGKTIIAVDKLFWIGIAGIAVTLDSIAVSLLTNSETAATTPLKVMQYFLPWMQ